MKNYKQLLHNITTLIFDIDGVLTDGTVIIAPNNEQLRTMHVRDGYALQLAVKKGYRIAIISGGTSSCMAERFIRLGITDIYLGVNNKVETFDHYIKQNNLTYEEVMYMGDDIPDFEIMQKAGVSTCPADAAEEIKSVSDYISPIAGGKGCARDIIEQIMKIHNKWFDQDAFHW